MLLATSLACLICCVPARLFAHLLGHSLDLSQCISENESGMFANMATALQQAGCWLVSSATESATHMMQLWPASCCLKPCEHGSKSHNSYRKEGNVHLVSRKYVQTSKAVTFTFTGVGIHSTCLVNVASGNQELVASPLKTIVQCTRRCINSMQPGQDCACELEIWAAA